MDTYEFGLVVLFTLFIRVLLLLLPVVLPFLLFLFAFMRAIRSLTFRIEEMPRTATYTVVILT